MSEKPLFSVFTPTYNRAHTLSRVFNCLQSQTCKDFEWIVIDDGSTDDTAAIVAKWKEEASFPVHYHWQPNQGKHIAYNHCGRVANGEFFVNIDSDDEAMPTALQRFSEIWAAIPADRKEEIGGVMCQCKDQHGKLVGLLFEGEPITDILQYLLGMPGHGEKWGYLRTKAMREFPFPEDVKNAHVPETYFMHQVAAHYKFKFVNDILRVYYVEDRADSLNEKLKKQENWAGNYYAYLAFPKFSMRLFFQFPKIFIANTMHFIRVGLHVGKGIRRQWKDIGGFRGRMLWMTVLPLGYGFFLRDKMRSKR